MATFRIMNLAESKRNFIQKDAYDLMDQRTIEMRAGYGTNLQTIFNGTYTQCYSVREGNTWVTYIEATDGGFANTNSISNLSLGPQYANRNVVSALINDLTNWGIKPGVIGQIDGSTVRSTVLYGPTIKLLNEMTNGNFFIDQGKAFVLGDNEALNGVVYQIAAETGLLGTPQLQGNIVSFEMVFEPGIFVGQRIALTSNTGIRFNGYYKVTAIRHQGIISENVSGRCVTQLSVRFGDKDYGIVG